MACCVVKFDLSGRGITEGFGSYAGVGSARGSLPILDAIRDEAGAWRGCKACCSLVELNLEAMASVTTALQTILSCPRLKPPLRARSFQLQS